MQTLQPPPGERQSQHPAEPNQLCDSVTLNHLCSQRPSEVGKGLAFYRCQALPRISVVRRWLNPPQAWISSQTGLIFGKGQHRGSGRGQGCLSLLFGSSLKPRERELGGQARPWPGAEALEKELLSSSEKALAGVFNPFLPVFPACLCWGSDLQAALLCCILRAVLASPVSIILLALCSGMFQDQASFPCSRCPGSWKGQQAKSCTRA